MFCPWKLLSLIVKIWVEFFRVICLPLTKKVIHFHLQLPENTCLVSDFIFCIHFLCFPFSGFYKGNSENNENNKILFPVFTISFTVFWKQEHKKWKQKPNMPSIIFCTKHRRHKGGKKKEKFYEINWTLMLVLFDLELSICRYILLVFVGFNVFCGLI